MKIQDALDLKRGDVVSLTGAGGKTSALFRLADELVAGGQRVVTTTTTRIAREEMAHAPYPFSMGPMTRLPEDFAELVERYRHVFAFSRFESDGKVRGIRPAWLDENLAGLPYVDALLVEADGSRRMSLKAPLPHEPVIPASSTIVIPVVGLSALGQPMDDEHVYGADLIAKIMGVAFGAPVTAPLIASLLVNPQFGLKGIPHGARVIPLLNQANPSNLADARQIAARVLSDLTIERVLLGAVQESNPILEIRRRIGAIILAAGQSRRMGQPKVLLPWGNSTIIRQITESVIQLGLHEIVIVAGEWLDEITKQVAGLPVRVVQNPVFAESEMLSSLRVGLQALWVTSDASMIILGDQPWINKPIVESLLNAYNTGKGRIIAPSYQHRRGHPLIIDRAFWQQIIDLPPGSAPRDVLRANEASIYHVEVDSEAILRDIDTPDDYEKARKEWNK